MDLHLWIHIVFINLFVFALVQLRLLDLDCFCWMYVDFSGQFFLHALERATL